MIVVEPLKPVIFDDISKFGFNGFKTNKIYTLEEKISETGIIFDLKLNNLESTYIKEWQLTNASILSMNQLLEEQCSFGAYSEGNLIGFIQTTSIEWNNSLWIENIRVAESFRGFGIGQKLLDTIEVYARENNFRLIGLEVMGSNVPAIELYKKHKFIIDGFDRSHYPTRIGAQKEFAIFMKKYLSDLV